MTNVRPTIRSAVMVVNTRSRSGQRQFDEVCEHVGALPFPVDARPIDDPDMLEQTVRDALATKPDLLILGGGDGTISGLVDLLVGEEVILGVLPFGTANSFARSIGLPLDIRAAVEVLGTGVAKRIDLGMIDNDYFASCAAMGISPRIAETVPHGLKKVFGRVGYLGWAAVQYARFKPFTLIVDDGTEERRLEVLEVRISNGPFHGGTEIVDEASVTSGTIAVQAVRGHSKATLVKNWIANVLRLRARHDDTVTFSGESLRIATEPLLPISIDGEVLAETPVTARVAKGVIRVMVPVSPPA